MLVTKRMAALLVPFVLAACMDRAMAPTTSLAQRACTGQLALADALPIKLGGSDSLKITVDDTSKCLQVGDVRHAYVAFRLPEASEPYLLSISSVVRGTTLFSPRLALLDAGGATVREIGRDMFVFRGNTINVGLRARPEERYLVVSSDAASVGQQQSHITSLTQSTAVFVAPAAFVPINTGWEATQGFIFTHNGEIEVSARALPKAG